MDEEEGADFFEGINFGDDRELTASAVDSFNEGNFNGEDDQQGAIDYHDLMPVENGDLGLSFDQCDLDEPQAFIDLDNFPASISGCFVINKAYQDSLTFLRDHLEQKLEENRAMQEDLINSESIINGYVYPNSLLKFLAPYFRDDKSFNPDDNEDTKSRKASGSLNIFYLRTKKPWKAQDKKDLELSIEAHISKRNLESFTRKENDLLEEIKKMEKAKSEEREIEEKREALSAVRDEIEAIKATFMLPRIEDSDSIDWLEVSHRCSSIFNEYDCEAKWINFFHPDVNRKPWTLEEKNKLKALVTCDRPDWGAIARELKTGRRAWQCCTEYQSNLNDTLIQSGPLNYHEITVLNKLIRNLSIGDFIPWPQVAFFMERRTLAQIKHHWQKIHCPRRGAKWTELEDKVLFGAVEKYGIRKWRDVAKYIPGRSNRQCRERYMMRLGIKDRKIADWTYNEDMKLISIAPDIKFRWVDMMAHILRRNPRQIAARYDTIEKLKIARVLTSSKDLQNLVPRRKPTRAQDQVNPITELNLEPGKTLEQFLREGRKELEKNSQNDGYRPKMTRPGTGGRKRKAESEEQIEQELVQQFSFYSLINDLRKPDKCKNRSSEDSMLFDVTKTVLESYFDGKMPETPHLVAAVVALTLRKNVIGLDPTMLPSSPPIFPPNSATIKAYLLLLFTRKSLQEQFRGTMRPAMEQNEITWHPQYRILLRFLTSLFFWPSLLSSQPPLSTKSPIETASTQASPSESPTHSNDPEPSTSTSQGKRSKRRPKKRRKKSDAHNIHYCNETREKQRKLFADYLNYLNR